MTKDEESFLLVAAMENPPFSSCKNKHDKEWAHLIEKDKHNSCGSRHIYIILVVVASLLY
jgi:hypothetical protein